MSVLERLSEEEMYLYCILSDPSGLDQMEFMIQDHETPERQGVWRAWSFQHNWLRCTDPLQIDQCARSIGKSRSIVSRCLAFSLIHTGQEMVITAPELNHLTAITQLVETQFKNGPRLLQEMLPKGKNQGITHRPFMIELNTNSRILGRIPQRSGVGVKGCLVGGSLVLTKRGLIAIENVVEGDFVWSHLNRWSEVRVVQDLEDDCYEVRGQGVRPLVVSSAHRLWVRTMSPDGSFGPLRWEWVDHLSPEKSYWTGSVVLPDEASDFEVSLGWVMDGYVSYRIDSVKSVGLRRVYNVVCDDHSYWAEGVFHHNTHPLWLEMDESIGSGTLILTDQGLIPIEDVEVGMKVFTHRNRWRLVTSVHQREPQETWLVDGYSGLPMNTTENHKFWVKHLKGERPRGGLTEPLFEECSRFKDKRTYWATPTAFGTDGFNAACIPHGLDETWLIGRYLADGCIERKHGKIVGFTLEVHAEKCKVVSQHLDALGWKYSIQDRRPDKDAVSIRVSNSAFAEWLEQTCGKLALNKRLPIMYLGADSQRRQALFSGYNAGDGYEFMSSSLSEGLTFGSVSKKLAIGMKLLAQTLGWSCSIRIIHEPPKTIQGISCIPLPYHRIDARYQPVGPGVRSYEIQGNRWAQIYSAEPTGEIETHYDLGVEEDHSFLADGIIVHNSQDFSHEAWQEIIETLKRGVPGACWRAHGVSRGVRDDFYAMTQPASGWKVHRYTALSRPTWTAEEREEKIQMYGSRNSPDYKRNILGIHGDSQNALFVLSRLMATVDSDELSSYNQEEYKSIRITSEALEDYGAVDYFLDFPGSHKEYKRTWAGCDVGWTASPTEILVFGETATKGQLSVLKLLTRIHLERLSAPAQADVVLRVLDFYNCKVFAMDATGAGLPLFQVIQEKAPRFLNRIKGYGFSEKRVVEIDQSVKIDEFRGDPVKDAGIERNLLDFASDALREFVDQKRIQLPWDTDLIGEWQGQTWTAAKGVTTDASGRPSRAWSKGKVHTLDAGKVMILGYKLTPLEELFDAMKKRDSVPDMFLGENNASAEAQRAVIW